MEHLVVVCQRPAQGIAITSLMAGRGGVHRLGALVLSLLYFLAHVEDRLFDEVHHCVVDHVLNLALIRDRALTIGIVASIAS